MWFEAMTAAKYAWIPGTALGVLCGTLSPLMAMFVAKGKHQTLVLNTLRCVLALGILCLLTGGTAYLIGQPYHVWYPILLTGVAPTFALSFIYPAIRKMYTSAEMRKMYINDMK